MRSPWLIVPVVMLAGGCSALVGVDFGDYHDRDPNAEGGPSSSGGPADDEDGAVADTPDATPTGCAADQKECSGACVSTNDPAYGCDAVDCLPCSVPFAKAATCKAGACAADGCADGHGDCDGDTKNGCEANLLSPATCGACTTTCAAPTSLCSPSGCVSSCPTGLTECSGGCVNTATSLGNCGACGKACTASANADPTCGNSVCGIACRTGFGDCTNNPPQACSALPKWYADADADGVGSAVSVQACTPPAGYVASSGDCLDTNANVHPGQTTFFNVPFTNSGGVASYDYDCSGVEVDSADHWPGLCDVDCDGFGYTPLSPARPAGAGVNPYCGSTTSRVCIEVGTSSGPIPIAPPGASLQSFSSEAPTPSLQANGCSIRTSTTTAVGCR